MSTHWMDIIQVSVGDEYTLGLKSDGSVIDLGYSEYGQCNVGGWDLN